MKVGSLKISDFLLNFYESSLLKFIVNLEINFEGLQSPFNESPRENYYFNLDDKSIKSFTPNSQITYSDLGNFDIEVNMDSVEDNEEFTESDRILDFSKKHDDPLKAAFAFYKICYHYHSKFEKEYTEPFSWAKDEK